MAELISHTFLDILSLLVTEYFSYALGVTILIGAIELFYVILGIRRKRL